MVLCEEKRNIDLDIDKDIVGWVERRFPRESMVNFPDGSLFKLPPPFLL